MSIKIKHKMASTAFILSTLCFALTSGLFYLLFTNTIQTNAARMNATQLQVVQENADYFFQNIEEGARQVTEHANIQYLFQHYPELSSNSRNQLLLKSYDVLDNLSMRLTQEIEYIEILPAKNDERLMIKNTWDSPTLSYKQLEDILQGKSSNWGRANKVVYVKEFVQKENDRMLGYIAIHIRDSFWKKLLEEMEISLYLFDGNGDSIYQQHAKDAPAIPSLSGLDQLSRETFIINRVQAGDTDWTFASVINKQSLLDTFTNPARYLIWSGVACFFISILFSFIVSYRITSSLGRMERLIIRIRNGELEPGGELPLRLSRFSRALGRRWFVIAVYLCIIIVPLTLSVYVMNRMFTESIGEQSETYYHNEAELVHQIADRKLKEHFDNLSYIFGDSEMNEWLADYSKEKISRPDLAEKILEKLNAIEEFESGDASILLLDRGKNVILNTGCNRINNSLLSTVFDDKNNTVWLPSERNCGTYTFHLGKKLVAIGNYSDTYFLDPLGYAWLSINESELEGMYRPWMKSVDSLIYIIDSGGRILSHPDKALIGTMTGSVHASSLERNDIRVQAELDLVDWQLNSTVPRSSLHMNARHLERFIAVMIAVNTLVVALTYYYVIGRMTARIRAINDAIEHVSKGDLGAHVTITSGDEMERLAEGFNGMVRKLKEQVDEIYKQGLRRKEAELNALQAQINPHFLYNTLESINWEAMMLTGGPNKVSEMVTALSDLLRLSISKGREIVTFVDEINHVKNYIIIQKERYSDKFDVHWEIEPAILSCKTLKLILQPLVENAIYHGLELKSGKGLITISGSIVQGNVRLEISDDGLGMDEEQLASVRKLLQYSEHNEEGRSIGIQNVNERIQLYFGKEFGIEIDSRPNKGTRTRIVLPLVHDVEQPLFNRRLGGA